MGRAVHPSKRGQLSKKIVVGWVARNPTRNNVTTISAMQIEFDPDKRDKTLAERGLDFAQAGEVFAGVNVTAEDARFDYGEPRFTTVGVLDGRMVILVWTPRGEVRRIISMRKANEREIARF